MFGLSPVRFTQLAVSLPTPLPLHVQVQIHWTMTAVYPVCAIVTKLARAYATRGTDCCRSTDSTCVHHLCLAPGVRHCRRPARKRPYRGGRRKQGSTIPVIVSDRPASQPQTLRPLTTPTFDSARRFSVACDTNSDNAICYSNLIKINTSPFTQELCRHFEVMFLNTQSVRNKTTDICDRVMHANVDLIFPCET